MVFMVSSQGDNTSFLSGNLVAGGGPEVLGRVQAAKRSWSCNPGKSPGAGCDLGRMVMSQSVCYKSGDTALKLHLMCVPRKSQKA